MSIEAVDKLQELDFTKQTAFNYLTCERLYPNYVYFQTILILATRMHLG